MTIEPAFTEPPHIRYGKEDEIHAWFTDPPGAIVQLAKPQRATLEQARWLVDEGVTLLRKRFSPDEKVILVLDYRNMTSRDNAARTLMMERAPDIAHHFAGVFIVPPLVASPVYRTTLRAAAALVSALGVNIHIVESLQEVMERHKLMLGSAQWSAGS